MYERCPPGAGVTSCLVVSDRAEHRASLRAALEAEGHRVLATESARAGLGLLEAAAAAVLIVERCLCAAYGAALARRLRERDAAAQVVVAAADRESAPPRELLRGLGLHGYHAAADGSERLLVLVDAALESHRELTCVQLAERLKTELLGSVSHEFRTPLNVIVGYVDLLRDGAFGACDPETRPVFDKLRGNAAYLLGLAVGSPGPSGTDVDTVVGRRAPVAHL